MTATRRDPDELEDIEVDEIETWVNAYLTEVLADRLAELDAEVRS